MTDQEIIQGLIDRDERVTKDFFFVKCRPLFCSIMTLVFNYEVDYDEMVNELYVFLMENDAAKLRNFQYRSTVYQWLKVLAIRFFIKKRHKMIEDVSHEPLYSGQQQIAADDRDGAAYTDLQRLMDLMHTKRYAYVIQRLMIDECEPEQVAKELNVTVANLYNIKRRAMAQLIRVALKDIKEYGK